MGDPLSRGSNPFDELGIDTVFAVLRTDRSRTALRALASNGGRMTLPELAGAVFTLLPNDADCQRIRTELHHVTLPRLDEYGVVTYDHDDRVAELQPPAEDILSLADHLDYVETRR